MCAVRVERPVPALEKGKAPESLPLDTWQSWTYKQYYDDACSVGKAMIKLGVDKFDSVNIFGFNSPEWFLADVGAIFCGAKAAGIYPTDTPEQVAFKTHHSGGKVTVVEDNKKVALYDDIKEDVPGLLAIVVWGEEPTLKKLTRKGGSSVTVMSWAAFVEMGRGSELDSDLEARMAGQTPEQCCTLIYTSGTTGNPKAVMVSHDNLLFELSSAGSIMSFFAAKPEEERIICAAQPQPQPQPLSPPAPQPPGPSLETGAKMPTVYLFRVVVVCCWMHLLVPAAGGSGSVPPALACRWHDGRHHRAGLLDFGKPAVLLRGSDKRGAIRLP